MFDRLINYGLLLAIKGWSRLLWRFEWDWVGAAPAGDRWSGIRVVAILNHTSLFEPIFAAIPPARFLRKIAWHGVVPVAAKTAERPLVGRFFRLVAAHVVSISRQRDHTWRSVLAKIDDPKAMVVILPEGRMLRPSGLDSEGRRMSVRGGVADILEAVPAGRLLICYSGGLHHVQTPGDRFPRLFRTVRANFELIEIAPYRERLLAGGPKKGLRAAVIADLEARRDRHCPVRPGTSPPRLPTASAPAAEPTARS